TACEASDLVTPRPVHRVLGLTTVHNENRSVICLRGGSGGRPKVPLRSADSRRQRSRPSGRTSDLYGEFDPGSGRTLAARLTHASRTVNGASAPGSVANGCVTRGQPAPDPGITPGNRS